LLVNTSSHKVVDSAIAFDTGYSGHRKLLFRKYINDNILIHQRKEVKQRTVRLCENLPFTCITKPNMV